VLIVPPEATIEPARKVVFACDPEQPTQLKVAAHLQMILLPCIASGSCGIGKYKFVNFENLTNARQTKFGAIFYACFLKLPNRILQECFILSIRFST
jgi:hypothetical protein